VCHDTSCTLPPFPSKPPTSLRAGLAAAVYLPYAHWLAIKGRFDEARAAYRSGGRPHEASALLQLLAGCAVQEGRWADAGHAHYQLAMEALQVRCCRAVWGGGEGVQGTREGEGGGVCGAGEGGGVAQPHTSLLPPCMSDACCRACAGCELLGWAHVGR
jgi:hypothetical protein